MKSLIFVLLFAVFCGVIQADLDATLDKMFEPALEKAHLNTKELKKDAATYYREVFKLVNVFLKHGFNKQQMVNTVEQLLKKFAPGLKSEDLDPTGSPKETKAALRKATKVLSHVNDILLQSGEKQQAVLDYMVSEANKGTVADLKNGA